VEVRLLGPLDVVIDGQSVPLGGLRQRAVLALLAIHANEVLSGERIADEIWGGEPPRAAATTLQGYVFHLRKALADGPATIETKKPGYVLRVEPDAVDVRRAERLIAEADEETIHDRPAVAVALLRDALALWRGEPLADFAYETFAETEIARLTELRLTATEALMEAELALGHHDQIVAELDALVRANPLRETLRGQLMLALHRSGRSAEALRVYSQGRELLLDELGIDPGLALQRLERAILLQDEEIEATTRPAPTASAGNLPAATTSFVGRTRELREVAGHLGRHRLVTLTGPGGSGKTRLAIEAATRGAAALPDGSWFIELAAIQDPALVAGAIADALGVPDEPDRPVLDGVVSHLRAASALLLIDNCEHLVDEVAGTVSTLLRSCPRLHVLATSREALGVEGELAWPVPTLDLPDLEERATLDELTERAAVALFVDRAETARPGFTATDANIATIVGICRRLDGMPLAIELAAARLRVLSVEQIADRLDDRFRLLTDTSRTARPHHRTLRATIDWSFDTLSEPEQTLFARLSVFSGTFTLERAEAVCGFDPLRADEVLDLVTDLVNKSLVTQAAGDTGGFRLLETIREYGADKLDARGEAEVVHRRYTKVFTAAATLGTAKLRGPDGRIGLDQLEAEHDDSRAALEWLIQQGDADAAADLAVALWPFWWHRASMVEGRAWLQRVLDLRPSPATRLRVLVGAARLANMDVDLDAVAVAVAEGLALADQIGDRVARGDLLVDLAERMRFTDDNLDEARRVAEEAASLLRDVQAPSAEANATRLLSLLSRQLGEPAAAQRWAQRCLDLYEQCGDVTGSAGARFMLANLALGRGELAAARDLLQQSLVQFREMRDPWGIADATQRLGEVALAMGDVGSASQLATASLRTNEERGNHRGAAQSLLLLGEAGLARGEVDRARTLCEQALEAIRSRHLLGYFVDALVTNARVALAAGEPDRAVALCAEGLAHNEARGATRHRERLLAVEGLALARLGDIDRATDRLDESLERAREIGSITDAARALEARAECAVSAGDIERAARYLTAARASRQQATIALLGPDLADHERTVAAVRHQVMGTPFGNSWLREWEAGETRDLDLRRVRATASGEPRSPKRP